MSGTIPPIPLPFGASFGNPGSPNVNRVDMMPETTNPINTADTINVSQSVVDENLPQLIDSRGGSHVTNVPAFDKEDFMSWKVRFLVFLDGLEPYLLKTLEDRPFVPMSSLSTSENLLPKRQNQWSNADSRLANQDKRLKSIIISCLPNDVMKSVIKCKTAKEIWNDLILAHEGPSDTRDIKIAALRFKFYAFRSLEDEKVNGSFTRLKCLLNDLENNGVTIPQAEDCDSDVKKDQRTRTNSRTDLIDGIMKELYWQIRRGFIRGLAGLGQLGNPWTKPKKHVLLVGNLDEPSVGKADARSGQWVDITLKKVHRVLSMTDGDERKHVLDYTHVDLHNVEDQRKNLVSKFNLLKQEISLHKSELSNIKNTMSVNCSLQNEVIGVNLENESLKDEIINLKRVIEKWTYSKVTLDQLLSEQVLGNIVKSLGRKGRRKEKISFKEVVFTKADESSSMLAPEIKSDSESECDSQEPLLHLPKLIGATPYGTSESLISLSDLNLNMADLTVDTLDPKKTKPSVKVSPTYVIKKKTEKSPAGLKTFALIKRRLIH
ncbi:hypothetical protein Tco_0257810 [Tanacetum coccineum]